MDVTLTHPKGFELDDEIIEMAKSNVKESGGSLTISNDIKESYNDADVIYIKSWGSRKHYGKAKEEKPLRIQHRESWRIKEEHLNYAK